MAQSKAETVEEYIASLPEDRRAEIERVRQLVADYLPDGYEEGMEFGMISWHIPLERYPDTYNGRPLGYAALASQKNYMSLYMMGCYASPDADEKLKAGFEAAGKKLDMGKSCIRFKKTDDLALDVIGEVVSDLPVGEYIRLYEASRKG